jgi:hypothetical protein
MMPCSIRHKESEASGKTSTATFLPVIDKLPALQAGADQQIDAKAGRPGEFGEVSGERCQRLGVMDAERGDEQINRRHTQLSSYF